MLQRRAPQRLPTAERSAQIIQRATQLFAASGYADVTMKEIARQCDITEPALYRHFPSKRAIYKEVIRSLRHHLDIIGTLSELERSDDIRCILTSLARTILTTYTRHPELSRILIRCSLSRHPMCSQAFRDLRGPFVTFLTQTLTSLLESGKIRPVHPEITARCFVGMVMDCQLSNELWGGVQGNSYARETIIRNNVAVYVHGLAPPPQHRGHRTRHPADVVRAGDRRMDLGPEARPRRRPGRTEDRGTTGSETSERHPGNRRGGGIR